MLTHLILGLSTSRIKYNVNPNFKGLVLLRALFNLPSYVYGSSRLRFDKIGDINGLQMFDPIRCSNCIM